MFMTRQFTQRSPGFLPRGLHEYFPAFGPLKYFLPGYFCGTLIGSRLNTYSSDFVNQIMVSYRPENRRLQCNPCSKCHIIRFLIFRPRPLKVGYKTESRGIMEPSST